MKRTTIFLTRHASTLWNEEARFQGSLNSPLSLKGRDQARQLGLVIRELSPEVLCTSTQLRSQETGAIALEAAGLSLSIDRYPELNEISLGYWEGKTAAWVKERDAEVFKEYVQNPQTFKHPNGEGFQDVLSRALAGMEKILEIHSGKRVWVITHGFVLIALLIYLRNIPAEHYALKMRLPGNAEVLHTTWLR
ncbi:MAG TPA: histidine phosphatase family protein [Thermotogota bacterium]|nr:histidine phosphatase family protein [Thermotogota bacterium]NLH19726.1 histidine phosphatase family protein [Thermotogaceae bacterium]OQC31041.1 MAG: putative phosphoserine phosphatase 2 [Thermotogota bacterium ADurb.Bin062]HNW47130.1 histidine phosphatase family protein [Thermotogota bacterium]HNY81568.1 histidine phosphatase family protein [Thermotogota bacterium]